MAKKDFWTENGDKIILICNSPRAGWSPHIVLGINDGDDVAVASLTRAEAVALIELLGRFISTADAYGEE